QRRGAPDSRYGAGWSVPGGTGWGTSSRSALHVRGYPASEDDHHEQLVRADQRDRGPRGHHGTRGPVAKAVCHVGCERRRDAQERGLPLSRLLLLEIRPASSEADLMSTSSLF